MAKKSTEWGVSSSNGGFDRTPGKEEKCILMANLILWLHESRWGAGAPRSLTSQIQAASLHRESCATSTDKRCFLGGHTSSSHLSNSTPKAVAFK